MPIKLAYAIRDGWKQEDNKRFGQCLELRFIDTKTEKILFRYAPLLEDERVFVELFNKLKEYDRLHKEIYSLVSGIDGMERFSFGSCERER